MQLRRGRILCGIRPTDSETCGFDRAVVACGIIRMATGPERLTHHEHRSQGRGMATVNSYLDAYFEPITAVFTRELAEKIVGLRPDPKVVARVSELAGKSDDGTLTDEERSELESYVDAGDFIALFKAKAHRYLAEHGG